MVFGSKRDDSGGAGTLVILDDGGLVEYTEKAEEVEAYFEKPR